MMKKFFVLLTVLVVVFCVFANVAGQVALAATTRDGYVLDDLTRDETFDLSLYPVKYTGRDLSLITIAESVDNELVLYVYQPYTAKTYYAKSVRMCTQLNGEYEFGNTSDYPLTCVSHRGVFYKYVVVGYSVSSSIVRHYNIVQLMRNYISGVDTDAMYDDTINAVPFEVAKQFTFTDTANGTVITEKELEVVRITSEYCGFVRYTSQQAFNVGALSYPYTYYDRYFAAIDTDKQIDDLLEAKVSYFKIPVTKIWSETSFRFGVAGITIDTLYSAGQVVYTANDSKRYKAKYGARTFTWSQIQTVPQFLNSLTAGSEIMQGVSSGVSTFDYSVVSAAQMQKIEGATWVLNYAETESHYQPTAWTNIIGASYDATSQYDGYMVTNLSILEFAFVTDGTFYRLGVVNGERSAASNTDGDNAFYEDKPKSDTDVLKAILLLVGVSLLAVVVVWVTVKVIGVVKRNKR